jgi:hypothetical protein
MPFEQGTGCLPREERKGLKRGAKKGQLTSTSYHLRTSKVYQHPSHLSCGETSWLGFRAMTQLGRCGGLHRGTGDRFEFIEQGRCINFMQDNTSS